MRRGKTDSVPSSIDLASVVRGLYGRVARRLDLDPSYVSRVARGERRSEEVEAAIGQEIRRIMKLVSTNHNGQHQNGKSKAAAKNGNKKAAR